MHITYVFYIIYECICIIYSILIYIISYIIIYYYTFFINKNALICIVCFLFKQITLESVCFFSVPMLFRDSLSRSRASLSVTVVSTVSLLNNFSGK